MSPNARIGLTALALSLGLALAGCENFDPTSIMDNDFFSTKKKLEGTRQPVFPEGTPGVAQGVPAELVKGYQPPPEPEPIKQAQPVEAKPRPKPKPKIVAKRKEETAPTAVTVGPSSSPAPASPASSPASASPAWPDPPRRQPPAAPTPTGGVAWPDPPAPR
jgi:hypothetical protein